MAVVGASALVWASDHMSRMG